jgi:hypothetical protein
LFIAVLALFPNPWLARVQIFLCALGLAVAFAALRKAGQAGASVATSPPTSAHLLPNGAPAARPAAEQPEADSVSNN